MRTFAALFLIAAIALVLSCQQPAETKAEMDKMAEQIKTLEGKVMEMNTKVEQLIADYAKHMADFHKKSTPTTKTKTTPAVRPPTRK